MHRESTRIPECGENSVVRVAFEHDPAIVPPRHLARPWRIDPEWCGGGCCGSICGAARDRKSTRLNSSHLVISYAVFCLKKKKKGGGHTLCGPEGATGGTTGVGGPAD